MKTIIANTAEESACMAAEMIKEQILRKPACVLGLATGSTPLLVYRNLVEYHRSQGLDFSEVTAFNLDEYLGLDAHHPQSYHYYMHNNLFKHINIRPENIHIPLGDCVDCELECSSYDRMIEEAGGIDLQLLGIGPNGHIGFNEPGTSFILHTHVTELSKATIHANSRFFETPGQVPKKAITMGIGTIMKAKNILLLATSTNKASIIKELYHSDIRSSLPATILKLHPSVTVILDREAARELSA